MKRPVYFHMRQVAAGHARQSPLEDPEPFNSLREGDRVTYAVESSSSSSHHRRERERNTSPSFPPVAPPLRPLQIAPFPIPPSTIDK